MVIISNLVLFGSRYLSMDQIKFVEDSFLKILLGPFLNTFTHLLLQNSCSKYYRCFTYIGLTQNSFRDKLCKNMNFSKHEYKKNSTELSNFVWDRKKENVEPKLQ